MKAGRVKGDILRGRAKIEGLDEAILNSVGSAAGFDWRGVGEVSQAKRIRGMIDALMKTTDFEFAAVVARIYSEAVGKGLDLPPYLVAVGANGSVMAERNEGLEE